MQDEAFRTTKNDGFMFSQVSYEEAQKVIFGAPMDYTVTFRPGSRFGPLKIREMSSNLEDYSLVFHKNIFDIPYVDIGDLVLPMGNAKKSLAVIYQAANQIFKDKKMPIALGGEHLISLPLIEAASQHYNDLVILHFDAHTDLRDEFEGEELSHSTFLKKATQFIKPQNIYSFGIRSGTQEEFEWAKENIHLYPFEVLNPFSKLVESLRGKNIYMTLDLDVFDPSVFPGTGTPEAGGIFYQEFIEVLKLIYHHELRIVGCDMVECSPPFDPSGISQALASKLLREILVSL